MSSISRAVLVVGLVVFTVGVASGGFGFVWRAADSCESGYVVTISELGENETADPDAEHVAYNNLSTTQQRLFREILTTEGVQTYDNLTSLERLSLKVVTYRGEQYETGHLGVADCRQGWALFILLGVPLTALGGTVAVVAATWRYLR